MSKRGAEIQGSKETGLESMSMNADAPQRATAAQLAKRRIKPLGQRRPRVGSPSTTTLTQSTPFSTIDPNVVPNPSSSSEANGFSFGQTQSFSQGNSQNTQPQTFGDQNNSSFSFFGTQSSSAPSSFSFSATTPNQETSNPFSMAPQESTFQGFKGNMFNVPPTANQAGQTSGGNVFGTGFGSQQSQQPSFSFSTSSAAPNNAFAASTPSGGNIFGQSAGAGMFSTSQPFMTAPETAQADKSSGDQMQMSPDGKPVIDAKSNMFNVSAPAPPSFTSAATTAPKFDFVGSFGQPGAPTTSSSATTSAQAPVFNFSASTPATAPRFGASTKPDESTKTSFSTSLFGSKTEEPAKTDVTTTAAPATSQSIFSAPSFGSTSTSSTLFGNFNKPKEEAQDSTAKKDTVAAEAPKFQFGKSLFGTTSKPEEAVPATPFGKPASTSAASFTPAAAPTSSLFPSAGGKPLFGNVSKPEASASGTSAAPSTATSFAPSSATPPLFSTSTNGGSFFSQTSQQEQGVSTAATQKDTALTKSLFTTSTPALGTSMFQSSTPTNNIFGSSSKPAESTFGAPVFGETPAAPTPKSTFGTPFSAPNTSQPATTEPGKPIFAFGQTSTKFSAKDSSKEPEKPAVGAKSISSTEPSKPAEKAFGASESIFKPVGPTQITPTEVSKPAFSPSVFKQPAQAAEAGTLAKKPVYVDSDTQTQWDVESEVAKLLPRKGAIPPGLSKAEKEDWIKRWRFQHINQAFKQQVATIDANRYDFEALIAYYYMLRQQIGYPCSMISHWRAVPYGSKQTFRPGEPIPSQEEQPSRKRKADIEDDEQMSIAKRGKSQATQTTPSKSPPKSPSKSSKRKAVDEDEVEAPPVQNGKRTKVTENSSAVKVNGDTGNDQAAASETLRMFISSYVAAQEDQSSPQPLQLGDDKEDESISQPTSEEPTSPDNVSKDSPPSVASGTSSVATNGSRSLFDRVEFDKNGQPLRKPDSDDKAADKDAGTPADIDSNPIASLFSGSKFASSFNTSRSVTPQFSFSSASATRSPSPANPKVDGETPKASPPKSIFAGITSAPKFTFGAPSNTSTPKAASPGNGVSTPNLSTLFGASTSGSLFAPKPTEPGTQGSNATLSPFSLSASTSVEPSPSATPVASDTGAGEPTEESENLPQVDLTRSGAGEEDEDVKFEIRARALKLKPGATWEVKGVGLLRILKHRDNGRSRMLLRADPSGNIVLNASLIPQVEYAQRATSVQFLVPIDGGAEQWALKVKETSKATELSSIMEELKKRD